MVYRHPSRWKPTCSCGLRWLKFWQKVFASRDQMQTGLRVPILWHIGKKHVKRFDGFTSRPFRPIELLEPLYKALNKYREENPSDDNDEVSISPLKKIMLVEDEENLRILAQMVLERAGYQVVTAANGKEGLDVVMKNPKLDVILVDLNMPTMNGFEFLKSFRSLGVAKEASIAVITSHTTKKTVQAGKNLGVQAWLTKPYEHEDLVSTVEKLLQGANQPKAQNAG